MLTAEERLPWACIKKLAESCPQRVAVVDSLGATADYQALQVWTDELVELLKVAGCRSGDIVAVVLPHGVPSLLTLLGVTSICGCIPLNPALTDDEMQQQMREAGVSTVICAPELTSVFGSEMTVIQAHGDISVCFWELIQTGRTRPAENDQNTVLLMSTSGTTSRPKIACISRANLTASIVNLTRSVRLTEEDRLLLIAPLFHAQGLIAVLAQVAAGGSAVVAVGAAALSFRRWNDELEPTWYTCGPTQHRAILAELEASPLKQHCSLRFIRSGGNTLDSRLKEQLEEALRVPVLNMCGLSETGMVAATDLDHPTGNRLRKSEGIEVAITNAHGEALGADEEGEIVVRGPSVIGGYLNNFEANRSGFWGDPEDTAERRWFRTGDLGRMDADGYLSITGRIKEMINRGGQKVNPVEIDELLMRHSAVKEAATFAIAHATLGEDVCCAVVVRQGREVSPEALQAFSRQSLAPFKVPGRFHLVSDIPRGATGKPQRHVLRARFEALPRLSNTNRVTPESPRSDLEDRIAAVWRRRLGCGEVGSDDSFWHLGGDSLAAESMFVELAAEFNREVTETARQMFREEPTVATLASIFTLQELPSRLNSHPHPTSSEAGQGMRAFLFRAKGDISGQYRVLSEALRKHRPLTLLSPDDGWYVEGLESVEASAARAVAIIRQEQPVGPYLVGGFCAGGTLAFEAANQLQAQGHAALLFLIDAPMPGAPHPVWQHTLYARHLAGLIADAISGAISIRRVAGFCWLLLHRLSWVALRAVLPLLKPIAARHSVEWLTRKAEDGYLPLYRVPNESMPVLQFAGKGRHKLWDESIRAWGIKTSGRFTLVALRGDHATLFTVRNGNVIAEELKKFVAEAGGTPPAHPL